MTGEEGYTVRGRDRYTIDRWSRKHTGQVAFFLGLFVGAGTALLFTNVSGREARERLVETSKSVTDQAGGYYTTARHSVADLIEKGRTWIKQAGPALTAALESGRDAYVAEKSRVSEEIAGGSV